MRVLLLALLTLLSAQQVSAREIRISHQWPAERDARDRAVRMFASEVTKRIPGISFAIYPNLSLHLKAEAQFEALQSGTLDMSVYVLPYAVKKVPEFSLAVLPGLYPSVKVARGLKGSKVSDQLEAVANAHGVHIVAWFWVPGGFVTRNREIGGPETVRGLRLRGGDPLFDLMLGHAGATPVDLTSDQLYQALRDRALDGALTSYETFVSTKIYEYAKHFTAGSPGIWMFANPLLIAKPLWDSLSDAEQQAFEQAAVVAEDYFDSTQNEAERTFVETFTQAGAKYHKFTFDEYLAWLRLAQQTSWRRYLAISPAAESMLKEVVETILDGSRAH
jgi:TRAP-type C4-dicarboxylate transport system substrate-binding protein